MAEMFNAACWNMNARIVDDTKMEEIFVSLWASIIMLNNLVRLSACLVEEIRLQVYVIEYYTEKNIRGDMSECRIFCRF